jgi:serine/threonine protein kinase
MEESDTESRWMRAVEVFHESLECSDEAREPFLLASCGADSGLLDEVRQMLSGHFMAGAFLESPAAIPEDALTPLAGQWIGTTLSGRYLLESELGRGGAGVVYLARDLHVHSRQVAVKLIHEHWAESEWMRSRFREEVHALAKLRHPAIVSVIDSDETADGRIFLVMEYLRGATLRSAIAPGGMDLVRAADLLRQLADALEAAHASGVLHRDLKPDNVILQGEGGKEVVRVLDFGLAKIREETFQSSGVTSHVMGTTDYMSPEQLRGTATAQSDLYAFGVVAFEMITGTRPFSCVSPFAMLDEIRKGVTRKPRSLRPDLSARSEQILLRAFEFEPRNRPTSLRAFAEELTALLRTPPEVERQRILRRRWIAGGAASIAGAGIAVLAPRVKDALDPAPQRVIELKIADPALSGFVKNLDIQADIALNSDRSGYDGLLVTSKEQGSYCRRLTGREKRLAFERGWRVVADLEPREGGVFVDVDFKDVGNRFDMALLAIPSGRIFRVGMQSTPTWAGIDIPVPPDSPASQHLRMEFDPVSRTASAFLNDVPVAKGYRGHTQYQLDMGVFFGVAVYRSQQAAGVVRKVRFEIL